MPRLQAHKITIPLSNIGLDERNPRLPPQQSQREAIRAMIEQQGEKIVHLAADIAEHGLSEAERFMAMVPDNRRFPYISLDGNRRLVALKLLHEPLLAEGILTGRWLTRLKKLAEEFANDPIDEVELAVFSSREHGALWVARRHSANMNGVGQDGWESMEKHRFDAWRGVESREWQVLQFVREHGNLSPADSKRIDKLPITTLLRLLSDSYVKERLGLEYRNYRVVTALPNEEVIKPLRRIILDLLDKKVDVTMLARNADRRRYIEGFALEDLPNPEAVPTHFHRLGQKQRFVEVTTAPEPILEPVVVGPKSAYRKANKEHNSIIPNSCQLIINEPHIQVIYQELRRLDVDASPNAGAMLLRLFFELSLDHYLKKNLTVIAESSSIYNKNYIVIEHLVAREMLTKLQAEGMHEVLQVDSILLPTVSQLTDYINSQNASPLPADLRRQWGNLQPVLYLIWFQD